MPRDIEIFRCETCFFSYNPSDLEDYEYYECQFEAYKSVPMNNTEADLLPRVHKTRTVCPNWRDHRTYEDIARVVAEDGNQ